MIAKSQGLFNYMQNCDVVVKRYYFLKMSTTPAIKLIGSLYKSILKPRKPLVLDCFALFKLYYITNT